MEEDTLIFERCPRKGEQGYHPQDPQAVVEDELRHGR